MIASKIQESCIHLFLINHLVNYFIFSKTFDSEFSCIKIWFTDQSSKPLEIKDKTNIVSVIN